MLMMSVQGPRGRGALTTDPVPSPRELAAEVTEVVQALDVKRRKLSAAASVAEMVELRAALTDLLEVLGSAMQGGKRVTEQRDYARVAREIRAVVIDAGDHREGVKALRELRTRITTAAIRLTVVVTLAG